MAEKKERKAPTRKDPKLYAHVVEYGSEALGIKGMNIPPRPMFGRTLDDYLPKFQEKVNKAQAAILAAWS